MQLIQLIIIAFLAIVVVVQAYCAARAIGQLDERIGTVDDDVYHLTRAIERDHRALYAVMIDRTGDGDDTAR